MSRAYRKWKADIKAYRRGELPECEHDYIILTTDTSMAAYMRIRRIRQFELKNMKFKQRMRSDLRYKIELKRQIQMYTAVFCNPYQQVSEEERIRQANELWRQYAPVH